MEEREVLNHWKYFISLEKDITKLKNYIEIHQDNFEVYSFELSKLLQLSCSEIDSVCRLLCKIIDTDNDYFDESIFSGNIAQYKHAILGRYPNFTKAKIFVPDLEAILTPWQDWKNEDSPGWWKSYNKVKHYRHSNFKEASLKNVLYSMSALMTLNLYLYRSVMSTPYANPSPSTNFFDSDYCSPHLITRAEKELPDFEQS